MSELTEQQVEALSDAELIEAVADNVHGAAFFSRVTHFDRNCHVLWLEAHRRGNGELYERGYRRAERLLT